ncbi:MAG: hypothetical protein AAF805_00335 [Planctomycetota bacterium]
MSFSLLASLAGAQSSNWTNSAGGPFENAANWDAGVPGLGDAAVVGGIFAPGPYTITANTDRTIRSLQALGLATIDLGGNTLTLDRAPSGVFLDRAVLVGGSTDPTEFTLLNGTIDATSTLIDPFFGGGPATLTLGQGTNWAGSVQLRASNASTATLIIKDGAQAPNTSLALDDDSGSARALIAGSGTIVNSVFTTFIDGGEIAISSSATVSLGALRGDGNVSVDSSSLVTFGRDSTQGTQTLFTGSFSGDGAATKVGVSTDVFRNVTDAAIAGVTGGVLTIESSNLAQPGVAMTIDGATPSDTPLIEFVDSSTADLGMARLVLGETNAGTMTMSSGSQLTAGEMRIGDAGAGTLNMIGGAITAATTIVGASGTGVLSVSTDAAYNAGEDLRLGSNAGGDGTLIVKSEPNESAGGSMVLTDDLVVGVSGSGSVDQSAGSVSVGDGLTIGLNAGAIGEYRQSGGVLTTGADLRLGSNGSGVLLVEAGAVADVGNHLRIGYVSGDGAATIDGGTLRVTNTNRDAFIGEGGTGTLEIKNGGLADFNDDLEIGFASGSVGGVTVGGGNGALATLDVRDGVGVGVRGEGSITVLDGGVVDGGNTNVGQVAGARGDLLVDGAGAQVTLARLNVGGTFVAAGGEGTVTIREGRLAVTNQVTIWAGGEMELAGGSLRAGSIAPTNGGVFTFTGGELNVDTFDGSLTQNGGLLTIGDSPGVTTITGDYEQNAGALQIELAGDATAGVDYDLLAVLGDATLDGELIVSLLGGYAPTAGDTFEFLTAAGDLVGEFVSASLPVLNDGLFFDVVYGEDAVRLTVAGLLGDFNGDSVVDAADYTVWRDHPDGPFSYEAWRANFGASASSPPSAAASSVAAPEPASLVGVLLGVACLGTVGRCRERRVG